MGMVLIVDDSIDTCKVLAAFLKRARHECVCATSAAEAREKLREKTPDLMILDLMMPYESGIDLLREIRIHPQTHEVPVIMYSAVSERSYIEQAMDEGATDYWLKGSMDMGDMQARLKAFLPDFTGWSEPPQAHPIVHQ